MRLRALLTTLALGAALLAPPLAGAADRHPARPGDRGRGSSYRHAERYRSSAPRYRSGHADSRRQYRRAPRYYAPRYRYDTPRYRYYAPRYRYRPYFRPYYAPLYPVPVDPYAYPYSGVYPYGVYPLSPGYAHPYPGYAYPYPMPYRRGVHGALGLGFPGFGFSLYF
jgi:hypothetical protein